MLWMFLAIGLQADFTPPVPSNQDEWLTSLNYPDEALVKGLTGVTEADIFVAPSGKPEACYVVVSSGSKELDGQTCAAAIHRGKFAPARDERGAPIAGVHRYRTLWSIRGEAGPRRIPADVTLAVAKLPAGRASVVMTLRYIVDERGRIEQCATAVSSGVPALDAAACRAMPGRYTFAPARDRAGKPWRAVRTQTVALEAAGAAPGK